LAHHTASKWLIRLGFGRWANAANFGTKTLELDIAIPDHTTLSRRGGLNIYGEGEWLDEKRGIRSPRRWPKRHLRVDADTHKIVAAEVTPDDVRIAGPA
jgi:hypothetical protein